MTHPSRPRRFAALLLAASAAVALHAAPSFADPGDHDEAAEHAGMDHDAVAERDFVGDPYPLATDPVTGEALGDDSVAVVRDGRQLRFADADNVAAFDAEPAEHLRAVDEKIVADQTPLYPVTTCVVGGGPLGAMGGPANVVAGNRLVRLCCGGCKAKLKADPAKYLAALDAAAIDAQAASYPLDACPVSGEALDEGGMEVVQTVVAGRLVELCCNGCENAVLESPAATIAKVDAARAAAPATRPAVN